MSERLAYVLDDEPRIGAVVCQILKASGFVARQFSEPVPFFVQLKMAPPEVLVLDLALGQTDAVEVIRQLDTLKYKGKILLISGRDESVLAEIQQIGVSHGLAMLPSLQKPFRVSDLKDRLAAVAEVAAAPGDKRGAANAPAPKKLVVSLDEALRKNWLELWYQAKIDLKSLSVCGAEALVRARHPELGIVLPIDLLPSAGDPLYQPLTRFVIRRAMADWLVLADQGHVLRLAVNVPASVMHAPDFIGMVRQLLPPDRRFPGLILELTEDEVMREPEWIWELAAQLKLNKVAISIDDFGTAYSSLARLRDLPCVELKLDLSFVANCSSDPHKKALCQTVVDLAHSFGAVACAEGVETPDDLRVLMAMGCDLAQGYLFAKPMPRDDFVRSLMVRAAKASPNEAVSDPSGAAQAANAR
jgi:EAL domain-containing protein (putative c-di-GMP-specific phosphodiesterase class I)/ActR/RegA family two-component response regulator